MHYKELYIPNRDMLQDLVYDIEHSGDKELKIDKLYFPLENKVFTKQAPYKSEYNENINIEVEAYDIQGIKITYTDDIEELIMIGDVIPTVDIVLYALQLNPIQFEEICNAVLKIIEDLL